MSGNATIADPSFDLSERKSILQQLHDAAQIGDITAIKCIFETQPQLPIDVTRRGGNTTLLLELSQMATPGAHHCPDYRQTFMPTKDVPSERIPIHLSQSSHHQSARLP